LEKSDFLSDFSFRKKKRIIFSLCSDYELFIQKHPKRRGKFSKGSRTETKRRGWKFYPFGKEKYGKAENPDFSIRSSFILSPSLKERGIRPEEKREYFLLFPVSIIAIQT